MNIKKTNAEEKQGREFRETVGRISIKLMDQKQNCDKIGIASIASELGITGKRHDMRLMMGDTIDNAVKRSLGCIRQGDYDAAIQECTAAALQISPHWVLNMCRGFALVLKEDFPNAKRDWKEVEDHSISCHSPMCPSKVAYFQLAYLTMTMQEDGNAYDEPLLYFNHFLSGGNEDDIFGLWLRGILRSKHESNLENAVADLKQAYALLSEITDNKMYSFKMLRQIFESNNDEMINRCEDVVAASIIQMFRTPFYGNYVNSNHANAISDDTDSESLLGAITPADEAQVEVGLNLAWVLGMNNNFDNALTLLAEILSIARENSNSLQEIKIHYLLAVMYMDMHNERVDRNDYHQLHNAESTIADLLRLENQHTFPEDVREDIRLLESELDRIQREET